MATIGTFTKSGETHDLPIVDWSDIRPGLGGQDGERLGRVAARWPP